MYKQNTNNRINYLILYRECIKLDAFKCKKVDKFDEFDNLVMKTKVSLRHYISAIFPECPTRRNLNNISIRISDFPNFDVINKVKMHARSLDRDTLSRFKTLNDSFCSALSRIHANIRNKTNNRVFIYFWYPYSFYMETYLEDLELIKNSLVDLIEFSMECYNEHVQVIIQRIEEDRQAAEARSKEKQRELEEKVRLNLQEAEERRRQEEQQQEEQRPVHRLPDNEMPVPNESLQEMVDILIARRRSA